MGVVTWSKHVYPLQTILRAWLTRDPSASDTVSMHGPLHGRNRHRLRIR